MNNNAPNPYLRTKIMTASPEELRLLLFDGCLKFCRQGEHELKQDKPNFEAIYENFMRAQKIVLELSTSLNHDANPELCEKLSALYTYVYRLLVDANLERDVTKVGEAIQLLEYERETWQLMMQKTAAAQGDTAGTITDAGAQQTAISSLSKSA
ncbi:flagellar export chaperone FliS [Algisphaera agarilytica]|uniref:Flagellar secretion chaperone FliS n=1 Tax=Algisphaera agarilytica TaxID=1385975 RepID=A0A7X0HAN6_9BACT|nr:flagellar export chaperone FliS [Algisphaera agarilytica]MBB6430900.1 flagellar protein FliS [Algisphaera agarilytica]